MSDANPIDIGRFQDRVAMLDTLAVGADANAKSCRAKGDGTGAQVFFDEKNEYLNELVEIGAAEVKIDATCDRGMVSIRVQVTGGRHHMPSSALSAHARAQLRNSAA